MFFLALSFKKNTVEQYELSCGLVTLVISVKAEIEIKSLALY